MGTSPNASGALNRSQPVKVSRPLPIQPAPIHPDLLIQPSSVTQAPLERKSFLTKEWTIPDRPKPGRKPKEPKPAHERPVNRATDQNLKKTSAAQPASNSMMINRPSTSLTNQAEVQSQSSNLGSNPNTSSSSIQQKYIDLLEQKITSLQTQQSKELNYYQQLATQAGTKALQIQKENELMRSQLDVLRNEVIRLRKKLSLLALTQSENALETGTSGGRIRKEPTSDFTGPTGSTNADPTQPKKARMVVTKTTAPSASDDAASHISHSNRVLTNQFTRHSLSQAKDKLDPVLVQTRSSNFGAAADGCGMCTSELDCVCLQVGLRQAPKVLDISEHDLSQTLSVAIRRRSRTSTMAPRLKVWEIDEDQDEVGRSVDGPTPVMGSDGFRRKESKKDCSGNPSDCLACCDDPFGKAFCTALSNTSSAPRSESSTFEAVTSYATKLSSSTSSDPILDAYTTIPCCGEPNLCGSQTCFQAAKEEQEAEQMISCSEAWRQLKVHPNIGNANLQLLAEVVARQSKPEENAQSALKKEHRRSDWFDGPHGTLLTVFDNMRGIEEEGEDGNSKVPSSTLSNLEAPELSPAAGNRLIKFVAQKSLQEALEMLDKAKT